MSPFSQLSCSRITNCAENKECPATDNPEVNCWELFGTDNHSFNICQDCIVYVSKQEKSSVSDHELREIMVRKGILPVAGKAWSEG